MTECYCAIREAAETTVIEDPKVLRQFGRAIGAYCRVMASEPDIALVRSYAMDLALVADRIFGEQEHKANDHGREREGSPEEVPERARS